MIHHPKSSKTPKGVSRTSVLETLCLIFFYFILHTFFKGKGKKTHKALCLSVHSVSTFSS